MYEIDQKFFNEDGSLNVEAACAAGRRTHARIAYSVTRDAWRRLKASFGFVSGGQAVGTSETPAERQTIR